MLIKCFLDSNRVCDESCKASGPSMPFYYQGGNISTTSCVLLGLFGGLVESLNLKIVTKKRTTKKPK